MNLTVRLGFAVRMTLAIVAVSSLPAAVGCGSGDSSASEPSGYTVAGDFPANTKDGGGLSVSAELKFHATGDIAMTSEDAQKQAARFAVLGAVIDVVKLHDHDEIVNTLGALGLANELLDYLKPKLSQIGLVVDSLQVRNLW